MKFIEFSRVASDEALSVEYMQKKYEKALSREQGKHFRSKAKDRAGRGKGPGPFSATRLGAVSLTHSQWLVIIKLFELSIPADEAAQEAGLGYKTTLKAFDALRLAIVAELAKTDGALRAEIKADEARLWGRRKGGRSRGGGSKKVVLGVLKRRRRILLEIVPGAKAAELSKAVLKAAKASNTIRAGRWGGYSALIFHGYGCETAGRGKMFSKETASANALKGFWSFAKERMGKDHGVDRKKFILDIKEMEWRYNNRDRDLFELLAGYMLSVPNP